MDTAAVSGPWTSPKMWARAAIDGAVGMVTFLLGLGDPEPGLTRTDPAPAHVARPTP